MIKKLNLNKWKVNALLIVIICFLTFIKTCVYSYFKNVYLAPIQQSWYFVNANQYPVEWEICINEIISAIESNYNINNSSFLGKMLQKIRTQAYKSASNKLPENSLLLNYFTLSNESANYLNKINRSNVWIFYEKLIDEVNLINFKTLQAPIENGFLSVVLRSVIVDTLDHDILNLLKQSDPVKYKDVAKPFCQQSDFRVYENLIKITKEPKLDILFMYDSCLQINYKKYIIDYKANGDCQTAEMDTIVDYYNKIILKINELNNYFAKPNTNLGRKFDPNILNLPTISQSIAKMCPNRSKELEKIL